jgi:lipid II:glycine glycyltransferase (peptidoglycan interpeptide bridge formation enzyme)
VDLTPDETAILGSMKSKWRYNIGLAEKKGVAVRSVLAAAVSAAEDSGANELETFYRLYKETAERDSISIHSIDYYRSLFEEAAKHTIDVRLYLASHEGEDLAGIVTLFRGKESVYLYGASSNHKRNLMAPYALQWQAMKDAKASGCLYYDLFGIPPLPPEELPDHPMAGLYRFKVGFIGEGEGGAGGSSSSGISARPGGRIIHRPGSWDYVYRPLVTALYSLAEKTRKKIWDIKKRLKRR